MPIDKFSLESRRRLISDKFLCQGYCLPWEQAVGSLGSTVSCRSRGVNAWMCEISVAAVFQWSCRSLAFFMCCSLIKGMEYAYVQKMQ